MLPQHCSRRPDHLRVRYVDDDDDDDDDDDNEDDDDNP